VQQDEHYSRSAMKNSAEVMGVMPIQIGVMSDSTCKQDQAQCDVLRSETFVWSDSSFSKN